MPVGVSPLTFRAQLVCHRLTFGYRSVSVLQPMMHQNILCSNENAPLERIQGEGEPCSVQ